MRFIVVLPISRIYFCVAGAVEQAEQPNFVAEAKSTKNKVPPCSRNSWGRTCRHGEGPHPGARLDKGLGSILRGRANAGPASLLLLVSVLVGLAKKDRNQAEETEIDTSGFPLHTICGCVGIGVVLSAI
eukprot:1160959-Pelagomonas_calceolata.AAC.8